MKRAFVCRQCGTRAPRWQGRCATCSQWNTIDEVAAAHVTTIASPLRDVDGRAGAPLATGVGELDRVLGGGFVAGSTTLLYGEPGVGKSTLALGALRSLALRGHPVLLVASEESAVQVAGRAARLGPVPEALAIAVTGEVDAAASLVGEGGRALCVVDSISALRDGEVAGVAGAVAQVRHATDRLCAAARASSSALVLIGHVTKDGELAGPRAIEHLVDTVVRIEGEREGTLRVVRAHKHRFAATGEVGLFEMAEGGLRELLDPTLVESARSAVPGVVLSATNDGSRSFLVEIQALVASSGGAARRVAHQVSAQRLALLLAVLETRAGVDLGGLDVYCATAGGLAATEPGVDLAIALAVASVVGGYSVAGGTVALGEVGLAGELRAITGLARRVREAERRGATRVIAPRAGEALDDTSGVLTRVDTLSDALIQVRPI